MEPDKLKMLEDFGRIFERLEMMIDTLELMPDTSMDSMLEVRTQLETLRASTWYPFSCR